MNLTDLIEHLTALRAEHGDVAVLIARASGYDYEIGYETANAAAVTTQMAKMSGWGEEWDVTSYDKTACSLVVVLQ